MAVDGSENFEAKDAGFPQTPRREPPVIEGRAEPEEGLPPKIDDPDPAEENQASPVPESPSPPAKKSGGLAWPLFILLGAVLAVGGAAGLHYFDNSSAAIAQLEDRLNLLTAKTESLSRLDAKIDALGAKNQALEGKITELDTALEAESNKATAPASDGMAAPLAELEKRVAAAEAVASAAANADVSLRADLQKSLDTQKASAEKPSTSLPANVQVNLAPLEARLNKIEQRLTPVESAQATTKADLRVVQEREAAARERPSQDQTQDQTIAILAINLFQKAQRGLPYEVEITALANSNSNADPAKLNLAKPFAALGVASERKLADQFSALAPALLKQADKAPPGQGFFERLAADALHLVHIERVGAQSGTDERTLVARIEEALSHNDVDRAYALWVQLSTDAKALSSTFGDAAKTRIDVLNASAAIESEAIANLSKPKS
jgi:hypothetical protein